MVKVAASKLTVEEILQLRRGWMQKGRGFQMRSRTQQGGWRDTDVSYEEDGRVLLNLYDSESMAAARGLSFVNQTTYMYPTLMKCTTRMRKRGLQCRDGQVAHMLMRRSEEL